MNNKNTNSTPVPVYDKRYPKYIRIPNGYWTSTPDNVVYVSKCKKCKKEHKTWQP